MRLSCRQLVLRCFLALALAASLSGCSSFVAMRMPEPFASKKLKEDPPPDYSADNNDLQKGAAGEK